MNTDASAILAGIGLVIGAVVWLVRLEGRQNVTDARFEDLRSDVHEIKGDVKTLLQKPFQRRGGADA